MSTRQTPPLSGSKSDDLQSSPRASNLPALGNFQTHRRTTSAGGMSASSVQRSPAPANVALSRGINVESGQRNTDNAMIAAAALAAAADIPLPLKKAREQAKRESSAVPLKSPLESMKPSDTKDDSAATEPEEDDKTDDESASVAPAGPVSPGSTASGTGPTISGVKPSPLILKEAPLEPRVPPQPIVPSVEPTTPQGAVSNPTEEASTEAATASMKTEPVVKPDLPLSSVQALADASNYRPPPLGSYRVDPDSGIIGCICGIEEDDGFTIQCDVCFRWQHCSCMGYKTNEQVPEDEYKCYYCDEYKWQKFDPEVCRADTMARLDMDKAIETQDIKQQAAPGKRKSLGGSSGGPSAEEKKKRKVLKNGLISSDRPSDKRKPSGTGTSTSLTVTSTTGMTSNASNNYVEIRNKDNDLLEDGVTAETYQGLYFRLRDYDYKTPQVRLFLESLASVYEGNSENLTELETVSMALFKNTKFSKVILPQHQRYLQERNEFSKKKNYNKTSVQVKPYVDNPKQKFVGITKLGLFISERAPGSSKESVIPTGTTVIEYFGEIDTFDLYAENPLNHYLTWGTVKPKVIKTELKVKNGRAPVPLTIDARFVGNEARFIRKSCANTANCEIKPIYIPQTGKFRFLVVTSKPITLVGENSDEELRLAWEWDEFHPIRKMLSQNPDGLYKEGMKFEEFSEPEKALLISGIDNMLNFVECACNTSSSSQSCPIFKIKKATSYLLRSTRKASNLSNLAFSKSKEELVMPKKTKDYVSWKDRLIERDGHLHLALFSFGSPDDSASTPSEDEKVSKEATPEVSREDVAQETKVKPMKDKSGLFKTPYKSQLMEKRSAPLQKFEIVPSKKGISSIDNLTEASPKELAVPVTSRIARLIRDTVDETLKPLAIAGNVNVSAAPEVKQAERPPLIGRSSSGAKLEESPVTQVKPSSVKKLSFADYKKKMK